ncbi:MAG TPA: Fe-Mn family superoxide dismutase [Bryobacteraceae bacterium]|nr:Fe-Mn family superoxide dismutase [Bryobacteraceae bacterium]
MDERRNDGRPIDKYILPQLAFEYSALEPHIAGRIMELHHSKHHAGYVRNANETLERLGEARVNENFASVAALENALAFNVSGHVLHTIFWQNLGPNMGGEPMGELAEQIKKDFVSFAIFKKQMIAAASTVMGSGWGALVWEPLAKRLLTVQIYDHQSNVTQGGIPLMVLDAWEHAWYLQYEHRKTDFFEAVWALWNWPDIEKRFAEAKTLTLFSAPTGAEEQAAVS